MRDIRDHIASSLYHFLLLAVLCHQTEAVKGSPSLFVPIEDEHHGENEFVQRGLWGLSCGPLPRCGKHRRSITSRHSPSRLRFSFCVHHVVSCHTGDSMDMRRPRQHWEAKVAEGADPSLHLYARDCLGNVPRGDHRRPSTGTERAKRASCSNTRRGSHTAYSNCIFCVRLPSLHVATHCLCKSKRAVISLETNSLHQQRRMGYSTNQFLEMRHGLLKSVQYLIFTFLVGSWGALAFKYGRSISERLQTGAGDGEDRSRVIKVRSSERSEDTVFPVIVLITNSLQQRSAIAT